MPHPHRCDITVLLDRSGSMASVRTDVEGGFARFLEEQRRIPGECRLSLVQFDSEAIETLFEGCPIAAAAPISLVPRGWTPLLDAVGRTIGRTGERLAALPEAERPGRVLFVIITDGLENASREFSRTRVRELIDRQQRVYSWEFLYLGANVDAFAEAGALGLDPAHAAGYRASPRGVERAFQVVSSKCADVRAGRPAAFTRKDRERLEEEPV